MKTLKTKNDISGLIFLNKYYKFIAVAIVIIVVVAGYFTVVSKKTAGYNQLKSSISTKIEDFKDAEKYYKKLQSLEMLIADFEKTSINQLAKLEVALPHNPHIPDLIAQIEALVASNGFVLTSFDFTESSVVQAGRSGRSENVQLTQVQSSFSQLPPNLKVLDLSISMSGGSSDYFSFKELLKDFESHIRVFDIVSLTFGETQSAGSGLSFNMRTYYLESM